MEETQKFAQQVIENVEKVIVGKREAIELLIVAMLFNSTLALQPFMCFVTSYPAVRS